MTKTEEPARCAGWDVALVDALAMHQQATFEWGVSDCLTMIADARKAVTGIDPMEAIRGTYASKAGATKALKAAGFKSVAEALEATFEPIATGVARRGDFGVVDTPDGPAAVIFMGAMVLGKAPPSGAGKTDAGQFFLPRDKVIKAFRNGA